MLVSEHCVHKNTTFCTYAVVSHMSILRINLRSTTRTKWRFQKHYFSSIHFFSFPAIFTCCIIRKFEWDIHKSNRIINSNSELKSSTIHTLLCFILNGLCVLRHTGYVPRALSNPNRSLNMQFWLCRFQDKFLLNQMYIYPEHSLIFSHGKKHVSE